jgi:Holliday junction resolvase RusA-like endonuclease
MKIVLSGRIPSKKNSKRIVMAGRRPMIISSKDYETWHTVASYELRSQVKGSANRIRLSGPKKVEITIFAPNKIKGDLSNKAESIMDLLVDNGVIEDDNWFDVPSLHLSFGGVDKANPRAVVVIEASE